jgi:hypothetical protein
MILGFEGFSTMHIPVPLSSHPYSPPRFDGDHISAGERESVEHLLGVAQLLGWYEHQFRLALALFDQCGQAQLDPSERDINKSPPRYPIIESPGNTLRTWRTIAARDGALSIYHFGSALFAIGSAMGDCPTISPQADHPAIRQARKTFAAALPSYEALRHGVGHAADFNTTIEKREKHSIALPWKQSFGEVNLQVMGSASARITEQLQGRTYYLSFEGEMHHYELSQKTLEVLSKTRASVYAAFQAAADLDFYQCLHCASRDLKEVYGGRIYHCNSCDHPVTDEMMMAGRYKRSRAAKSAQSADAKSAS